MATRMLELLVDEDRWKELGLCGLRKRRLREMGGASLSKRPAGGGGEAEAGFFLEAHTKWQGTTDSSGTGGNSCWRVRKKMFTMRGIVPLNALPREAV